MTMRPAPAGATLVSSATRLFAGEVLRWNRQFNLVSRRQTEKRLTRLLRQSALGMQVVWDELLAPLNVGDDAGGLWYLDLGSGAGLPGFVWHTMLAAGGLEPRTWLVEPRDKRAWFLERLPKICSVADYTVLRGRWGEVDLDSPGHPHVVLISLKALHLTDREILEGLALAPTTVDTTVVIVRYYPPEQRLDGDLEASLGISPTGTSLRTGDLAFRSGVRGALSVHDGAESTASIVFSLYETS